MGKLTRLSSEKEWEEWAIYLCSNFANNLLTSAFCDRFGHGMAIQNLRRMKEEGVYPAVPNPDEGTYVFSENYIDTVSLLILLDRIGAPIIARNYIHKELAKQGFISEARDTVRFFNLLNLEY